MLCYGLGADIPQPISPISSSFFTSKDEISAPSNREENERCLTSCSDKWMNMLVQDVSGTYSKPTSDEEILQIRRLSNLNFFTLNQVLVISHAILVLLQNICVALTSSFYSHTLWPLLLLYGPSSRLVVFHRKGRCSCKEVVPKRFCEETIPWKTLQKIYRFTKNEHLRKYFPRILFLFG